MTAKETLKSPPSISTLSMILFSSLAALLKSEGLKKHISTSKIPCSYFFFGSYEHTNMTGWQESP